jgi:hypothetical protein
VNNSFERIIDGMIDALRLEIIPHTHGEYPRGQAFGIIFLLQSLKLRASWSPAFLQEQLVALRDLRTALSAIDGLPADAPVPRLADQAVTPQEMIALRDAGDERVGALIDWLQSQRATLGPGVAASIEAATNDYIRRQLRHEMQTSAKPMFAAISLGREET